MFFMIGITQRREELSFSQPMTCTVCGRYGSYTVFMTCSVLTFFFIPTIRWNRRYYVRTTCCGQVYALSPEKGKHIEWGEDVTILPGDLTPVGGYSRMHHCPNCGYTTNEDFSFCPKCGRRF